MAKHFVMKKQIMKKLQDILSAMIEKLDQFVNENDIIERIKMYKFGKTDDV